LAYQLPMISPETILRAKSLIEGIEKLQNELASLFGGAPVASSAAVLTTPKRRGRPPGAVSGGKKPRNMTPEGRARIAAAARARWARFHADKKKAAK
jgi:hypothetical protein